MSGVVTHVRSLSFLVTSLIACSGFSSLRPLSPLLQITESAREDELLPSSSNQGLDPKTFLTPLSNISSQHQSLRNLTCTETPPLFTITPLVSLHEDNPEPDSTTFDTLLEEINQQSSNCLSESAKECQETSELFSSLTFPELSLSEDLGAETDAMSGYYSHMDMNPFYGLVNIK